MSETPEPPKVMVTLIGASGTGKSSLAYRLHKLKNPQDYVESEVEWMTSTPDLTSVRLDLPSSPCGASVCRLMLWDAPAAIGIYDSVWANFTRQSDALALLFDVTRPEESLKFLADRCRPNGPMYLATNQCAMLIASKCDVSAANEHSLELEPVAPGTLVTTLTDRTLPLRLVSAKTGCGVVSAFQALATSVLEARAVEKVRRSSSGYNTESASSEAGSEPGTSPADEKGRPSFTKQLARFRQLHGCTVARFLTIGGINRSMKNRRSSVFD